MRGMLPSRASCPVKQAAVIGEEAMDPQTLPSATALRCAV